jgi:ATP-binding cassette subfamily A (ABC1) protein 3
MCKVDEADELGDRVAILSRGRLKCLGSSLYLKNKFGVGYSMVISKQQGVSEERKGNDQSVQWDPSAITQLITSRVAGAEKLSQSAGELSYRLPLSTAGANLPDLFDYLDAHKERMGIQTYGLGVTTLEDIFLKIAHDEEVARTAEKAARIGSPTALKKGSDHSNAHAPLLANAAQSHSPFIEDDVNEGEGVSSISPTSSPASSDVHELSVDDPSASADVAAALQADSSERSWIRQVRALVRKRINISRRDKKALFCSIGVPCYLLIVAMITSSIGTPSEQYGSLILSTLKYPNTNNPVYTNPETNTYITQLLDNPHNGMGVSNETLSVSDWVSMQQSMLDRKSAPEPSHYAAFFGMDTLDTSTYTVATNISAVFAQPTFLNLASIAMLRGWTGESTATIQTTLQPFQRTASEKHGLSSFSGFSLSMMVGLAFGFIPASFVALIVYERETRSKHLQILSGVSMSAYWVSHAIWDFAIFSVPAIICVIILIIDGNASFTGDNLPVLLVALLLYGFSCIPFSYVASWLFKEHLTAQNVMVLVSMIGGMGLSIVNFMLWQSSPSLSNALRFVFRLMPVYALADSLFYLSIRQSGFSDSSPWALDCTGYNIIFMALESVIYFLIVIGMEWLHSKPELLQQVTDCISGGQQGVNMYQPVGMIQQRNPDGETVHVSMEDSDVIAERARLATGGADTAPIQLHGLRKVFPAGSGNQQAATDKVAVNNLSFAVQAGECFGFLGQNGAGSDILICIPICSYFCCYPLFTSVCFLLHFCTFV